MESSDNDGLLVYSHCSILPYCTLIASIVQKKQTVVNQNYSCIKIKPLFDSKDYLSIVCDCRGIHSLVGVRDFLVSYCYC